MTRDLDYGNLDYRALTRRAGLRDRLRAVADNNLMVMGGTVAVLAVVVPVIVVVALVATGNATDVGGLVLLGMIFVGGVYAVVDVLLKSGGTDAFARFAAANRLTFVSATPAPGYAGSLFADGSHIVHRSVRTRQGPFREVGERFPLTARRVRVPNEPTLFLRARLAGVATREPALEELVPPDLHEALTEFAGGYAVEIAGDELTVFGLRGLQPDRAGRVQRAFALTDELVARAGAVVEPAPVRFPAVDPAAVADETGETSSVTRRRGPRPLVVVAWTLALMVVGPLLIAIVMSTLDDHLRGDRGTARWVVGLVVAVVMVVVARIARAAVGARGRSADRRDG